MQISWTTAVDEHRVALRGRFDFSAHKEFRNGYDAALTNPGVQTLVVEMSGVEYLDSAALGMLLLLQERATAAHKQVVLAHPSESARQVLEVANFHKLFSIR